MRGKYAQKRMLPRAQTAATPSPSFHRFFGFCHM